MSGSWVLWVHAAPSGPVTPGGQVDYKFYCFGGEPRFLYVSQGLEDHSTARISFLTMDWDFAPFGRGDYRAFDALPPRPACFDEMVGLSRRLSEGIPFVRVDFFEHGGAPRFSEMTFSPCGGFMRFDPPEWDGRLGSWIDLSGVRGASRG